MRGASTGGKVGKEEKRGRRGKTVREGGGGGEKELRSGDIFNELQGKEK